MFSVGEGARPCEFLASGRMKDARAIIFQLPVKEPPHSSKSEPPSRPQSAHDKAREASDIMVHPPCIFSTRERLSRDSQAEARGMLHLRLQCFPRRPYRRTTPVAIVDHACSSSNSFSLFRENLRSRPRSRGEPPLVIGLRVPHELRHGHLGAPGHRGVGHSVLLRVYWFATCVCVLKFALFLAVCIRVVLWLLL